jgi:hypothetical protein
MSEHYETDESVSQAKLLDAKTTIKTIGCSLLKFPVKFGVEESIVNAPLVSLSSTCRLKTQTTQKVTSDLNSFITVVM